MPEPETPAHFDIVVVGAGMVGAALALGLGRQGWRVALVERAEPEPVSPGAALDLRVSALNSRSETLLRQLDAWRNIEAARSAPFDRLCVWEAAGPTGLPSWLRPPRPGRRPAESPLNEVRFDARALGQSGFGHIVENSVTQSALWSAIADEPAIQRFCPDGLLHCSQNDARVEVSLSSGKALTAALVIGADGAESKVRTLAGIGIYREQYEQQALVASVTHAGPPQSITWQEFHPSGPRAYLPLPGIGGETWASLVWYDSPERIAELRQMPEAEFIRAVQEAFPARLPAVTSAPARGNFPLAKMQAHNYYRGRIALIGDAAHTINPLAGLGVNLGFQDVDCLLRLLASLSEQLQTDPGATLEADPASVLDAYQAQRRPAAQQMIWLMDLFYYSFSNRNLPLKLARNLGLFTAQRLPLGKELVARYAMGVFSLPGSLMPQDIFKSLPLPPGPGELLAKLRPGSGKARGGTGFSSHRH